jgi:hypothetical protein
MTSAARVTDRARVTGRESFMVTKRYPSRTRRKPSCRRCCFVDQFRKPQLRNAGSARTTKSRCIPGPTWRSVTHVSGTQMPEKFDRLLAYLMIGLLILVSLAISAGWLLEVLGAK